MQKLKKTTVDFKEKTKPPRGDLLGLLTILDEGYVIKGTEVYVLI